MNRCSHPAHPHCTVWVMPGESVCAHGHPQPAPPAGPATGPAAAGSIPVARPHLHVSGFDPRAAGGRQVLKLELRGMPADCPGELTLQAASRLRLDNGGEHRFTRTARGQWLPVFLEFSSRGLEHGQYRIELALHAGARAWSATLLILAPRCDASLHEIHQTFLATHKNVRVSATDASIARVSARLGAGSVDIGVDASNAGIAHLELDAGGGKVDLGYASIAWDEDLLDIDVPARTHRAIAPLPALPALPAAHPCPASTGCLVFAAAPGAGQALRHLRLFALDECVLGRLEPGAPGAADLLLAQRGADGAFPGGLTRRISARHALIRRGRDGYEIEDVSRYGLLLDGAWPGRHMPLPLREGMRIELTASIPGVVVLEVAALLENGVLLYRADAGRQDEAFLILDPERDPQCHPQRHAGLQPGARQGGSAASTDASPGLGLPLLFHRDGGFWQRERGADAATPLTPSRVPAPAAAWPSVLRFAAHPYPELRGAGAQAGAARSATAPRSGQARHGPAVPG